MCGVAASFNYGDGLADLDAVTRLCALMSARGPDGDGIWQSPDRCICLGHRRLAIIDTDPRANQPMVYGDGRFVISFNGEIYNFAALKRDLQALGYRFITASDTEVVLALYAQHGAAMLTMLRGMFAFALWDDQARQLLLARDPYGIKPLYFTDDGTAVQVCSSARAFAVTGLTAGRCHPGALGAYLALGSVPDTQPLDAAVKAVPAGGYVRVDEHGAHEAHIWYSVADRFETAAHKPGAADRAAQVRRALSDSVAAHLVADVPVGIFLSAGIDSGSLLGLLHGAGVPSPMAITAGFGETSEQSEISGAQMLVRHYAGTRSVSTLFRRQDVQQELPAFFACMDQPTIDGLNTWLVAKVAKAHGLKVALSGVGGDELFCGYPSFRDIPKWLRIFGWMRRKPCLTAALGTVAGGVARAAGLSPKMAALPALAATLGGAYMAKRGLFTAQELATLLTGDAWQEAKRSWPPLTHPSQLVPGRLSANHLGANHLGANHLNVAALESIHYLRTQLLRDADWAGMAHSVEIRTPLVDRQLLESVLLAMGKALPPAGKKMLANAPPKGLPAALRQRRKTGFTVPVHEWLLSHPAPALPRFVNAHWSRRWALEVLAAAFPAALDYLKPRFASSLRAGNMARSAAA
ncbi:MAG: asparagine synthase (glutamine-hydrolyzing) [Gammaproteobacteria bacterium]|nr:asparagine synthase (glutamine-hydrolyzing) [Gammaproteobacteria bacterium]